ncbi:MAG: SAM-dependent methyltransferase [Pseudonocardiaceae bacterium]
MACEAASGWGVERIRRGLGRVLRSGYSRSRAPFGTGCGGRSSVRSIRKAWSPTAGSDLARFVAESELSAGQLLVDVGCGRGGAGLHVAEQTGARLLGLDISAVAVEEARARAVARGLAGRASFRVGEFERTGLDEASVRVVMSVDALTFAEDKAAALRELARVLEPEWSTALHVVGLPGHAARSPPSGGGPPTVVGASGFRGARV